MLDEFLTVLLDAVGIICFWVLYLTDMQIKTLRLVSLLCARW